jgi:hypothetical protein
MSLERPLSRCRRRHPPCSHHDHRQDPSRDCTNPRLPRVGAVFLTDTSTESCTDYWIMHSEDPCPYHCLDACPSERRSRTTCKLDADSIYICAAHGQRSRYRTRFGGSCASRRPPRQQSTPALRQCIAAGVIAAPVDYGPLLLFTTTRQAAALCQAGVDNGGVTAVPGTLSSLSAETTRWQPRPIMHPVAGGRRLNEFCRYAIDDDAQWPHTLSPSLQSDADVNITNWAVSQADH